MSWPPPRLVRLDRPGRPWRPESPSHPELGLGDTSALRYVVVDEIVGDWVGLSVSEWPVADDRGRLTFELAGGSREVGVTRRELERFLAGGAAPADTQARARIGAVFAAEAVGAPPNGLLPLTRWLRNPRDITDEARKVAKLAFYAGVAPTLTQSDAQDWDLMKLEE